MQFRVADANEMNHYYNTAAGIRLTASRAITFSCSFHPWTRPAQFAQTVVKRRASSGLETECGPAEGLFGNLAAAPELGYFRNAAQLSGVFYQTISRAEQTWLSSFMSSEPAKVPTLYAVPSQPEAALFELPDEAFDEPEICPLCHGSGLEVVPGKGARPCSCRKEQQRLRRLETARIPPRYNECSLQNYYPVRGKYFSSQGNAHRFAYTLAQTFPAVDKGLLFMGPVGVGKTHLSVAIIRDLLENKGVSCLFYEFGALLKEIQNSYSPVAQTSELSVLAPVFEAEALVLDELGASKPTDWVRDTMMHIINTRYNEKKLTIFTTNYLDARATDREETLEDRIGIRLRSRLYEMCKTILIEGHDYRRRLDK
jgi:DNA replication protein DnaC